MTESKTIVAGRALRWLAVFLFFMSIWMNSLSPETAVNLAWSGFLFLITGDTIDFNNSISK
jgi:hypothetical protein